MSLINLHFGDHLTPSAPFQLRKLLPGGGGQLESSILVAVRARKTLAQETLAPTISSIAHLLLGSTYGEKLRIALELYAGHFTEQQVRVRFLLLVMAMESLAKRTLKHQIAIDLLDRWHREVSAKMQELDSASEEFLSLEALSRELAFRREDSIRAQVRKLFTSLPGVDPATANELQRRALRVYDKRSALVHDGHLPTEELSTMETEARQLLERVFASAIEQGTNAGSGSTLPGGV